MEFTDLRTSHAERHPSATDRSKSRTSKPVSANRKQVPMSHSNSQAAETGEEILSTVLLPFSGRLTVDTKLKLSDGNFEQRIWYFYTHRQLSAVDQLTTTLPYPTPHVLVQFASMAYRDCKHGDPELPDGWQLLTTASHLGISNGYFGAAFWHPEHQQVVIAHRGTANAGGVLTDVKGVLCNKSVPQMSSAITFANKVVTVLQEIEQEKKVCFEVFFTGHSSGGWLAQITAFTTEYLEVKGGTFVKRPKTQQEKPTTNSTVQDSHDVTHSYHPHTVVFDSPGCKDMLSQMADKLDVRYKGRSIDLQQLDITSYLSAPNRINTCKSHVGTVYRIFTDLSDMDWRGKHTLKYNLATHRMDKIEQAFDPETGQVRKDDEGGLKIQEVVDWPVREDLRSGAELNDFFIWAKHLNNYHPEVKDISHDKLPKGYHPIRYQTKAYDGCTNSLSVFTEEEREFLENYGFLRDRSVTFDAKELFTSMRNDCAQIGAEVLLLNFKLDNETFCCPDASTLNILIPYVKRLVRLFPHIKQNAKDEVASSNVANWDHLQNTNNNSPSV
jgi:hypothetical protein